MTSTSFEDDFAALNGVRNSNLQNNEAVTYGYGMIYVALFYKLVKSIEMQGLQYIHLILHLGMSQRSGGYNNANRSVDEEFAALNQVHNFTWSAGRR